MRVLVSTSKIPVSQARPYVKNFNRARYAALFNKFGEGKGKDKYRIYIPLSSVAKPDSIVVPKAISKFLASKQMTVDNYRAGTAFLPDGKRVVRIGKVLADKPDLKRLFDNDANRGASKSVASWVVVSRHPYDIIGMSFDRGWTSCMHLTTGTNKKYLEADVKFGSLVAYLIKETDKNINAPVARITLKPHVHGNHTVFSWGQVYGTAPAAFEATVAKFCKDYNLAAPTGKYALVEGLYNDIPDEDFDEDIPAYYFHLREGDSIPKTCTEDDLVDITKTKTAPVSALNQLITNKSVTVRKSLAVHTVEPSILAKLSVDKEEAVVDRVVRNQNTDAPTLDRLSDSDNQSILRAIVSNQNTSPATLRKMYDKCASADNIYFTRLLVQLADCANLPPDILAKLGASKLDDVVVRVARNGSTPDDTLRLLLSKNINDNDVITALAQNTGLPDDIAEALAKHRDKSLRCRLAKNKGISGNTLKLLLKDKDQNVFCYALGNENTTKEMVSTFVKDSTDVRLQKACTVLVGLPTCVGEDLARVLRTASTVDVEVLALRKDMDESLWEILASSMHKEVRQKIASDDRTPVRFLVSLTKDKDPYVRSAAMLNDRLPVEVLRKLSTSTDSSTRGTVARNTSTPFDVLSKLAEDPDTSVPQAIVTLARTTPELLAILFKCPDSSIRKGVVEHRRVTGDILDIAANDASAFIRNKVADHDKTRDSTLKRLLKDPNSNVRDTARSALYDRKQDGRKVA